MSRVKDKALQKFVDDELVIGSLNDLDLSGIGLRQCIFRNELGEWVSKKLEFADDINGAPVGLPSKSNTASVNPSPNDDTLLGYTEGSFWLNTSSKTAFICVDPFEAMADWKVISNFDTTASYTMTAGNWLFEGASSFTVENSEPTNFNTPGFVVSVGNTDTISFTNGSQSFYPKTGFLVQNGPIGTTCIIKGRDLMQIQAAQGNCEVIASNNLILSSSAGTIQVKNPNATGGTIFYDQNNDPVLTITQVPGAYDITAALTYTAPLSNSLMTRAHVNTVINSAIPYAYYYVDDCATSSGGTQNQINLMLLSTGTTSNLVQNFTVGNNLFTYTGTTTYNFQVNFTFTPIVTSNDRTLHVYLYKNTSTTPNPLLANRVAGSRVVSIVRTLVDDTESVSGQCFVSLSQNDFVRFYVVNAENNDAMTIVDARVSIRKI